MGDTLTLTIPTGIQNKGSGWVSAEDAITTFAGGADGGYMFNVGGNVTPSATDGEGVITLDSVKGICLTLYPRTGAGGSGEAIVLSGTELAGSTVSSFTFDIAGSSCTSTADIALTLAVISKDAKDSWTVLESQSGSITLNSGASVTLTLVGLAARRRR